MITTCALMSKARQACDSAHALLELSDADGACNRAYYAMFDAARAALLAAKAPVPTNIAKTHSGVLNAFSLYLVKTALVPRDIGRLLKRAEEIRIVADYNGESIELSDAREMVEQAEIFLQTIRATFMPDTPSIPKN